MEKLIKKYVIKGSIEAITGIRVGGASNSMSIGGIDNPIIRNPVTGFPYIPGSSLKGKMRSLLDLFYGSVTSDGETMQDESKITSRLFGMATKDKKRFSRLIVRDANLIEDSIDIRKTELPYSEVKYENSINRITAEANPRPVERVPAGAKFSFELVLNILEGDKKFGNEKDSEESKLIDTIFLGLRLVQDDYLGGYGSRGSGQVAFEVNEIYCLDGKFYEEDKSVNKLENLVSNESFKKNIEMLKIEIKI